MSATDSCCRHRSAPARSSTGRFIRAEPITFANLTRSAGAASSEAVKLADYINAQFDPALQWKDLEWFRSIWKGPIVLKGIQTVEDALLAGRAGVDAVALSNHGGRQLDGAPPPIELLAPVADAVGDQLEVICDGGIRRGSDIVKAVALGARACMIGRPYLYGYGAAGEAGIDHALGLLGAEVRRTMALAGCHSLAALGPELVARRPW
jgi:L-lactate dehydrogenase (cytochrome)